MFYLIGKKEKINVKKRCLKLEMMQGTATSMNHTDVEMMFDNGEQIIPIDVFKKMIDDGRIEKFKQ